MTGAAADNADAPRLECRGLSVRRGVRIVVEDINLALRAGECLSLVGPNGSGKTTLLLALLGLLPAAAGSAQMQGHDVRDLSARQRGRLAAYVPQSVERVPAFRVIDVVAGGRFPYVGPLRSLAPEDHAAIRRALACCGLEALAERALSAVSGGERQKTLIAAAIAQDPQVLCLDEPNTALDPAYQLELVRILRDWQRSGRSLVLISHDLQLPAALGGRVLALRAGRVAAGGAVADVLTPEVLAAIYGARFATATTAAGDRIVMPEWWRAG